MDVDFTHKFLLDIIGILALILFSSSYIAYVVLYGFWS
jgi:hypothetical protein